MRNKKIVCWWSGGITSAVACKIAIDLFGKENCRVIMIDTKNEDEDTYRFREDCSRWYGLEIEVITGITGQYSSIQDVWERFNSLNNATGAICSAELKREVRERWQKENEFDHQVFGFEFDKKEYNRAQGLRKNYKGAKGIFPLLMFGHDKDDCIRIVREAGIKIPRAYSWGFKNNNCLNTGCVQGGIGYWKKMQREFPDKFNKMADMEHKLTDQRGQPVTMLKDQSNDAKKLVEETGEKWRQLVFLKPHPNYPDLKCLDDMKDREVKPLTECNGFCSINVFNPVNKTEEEINFEVED